MEVENPGSLKSALRAIKQQELFGGAIVVSLPESFEDISNIRQVICELVWGIFQNNEEILQFAISGPRSPRGLR